MSKKSLNTKLKCMLIILMIILINLEKNNNHFYSLSRVFKGDLDIKEIYFNYNNLYFINIF